MFIYDQLIPITSDCLYSGLLSPLILPAQYYQSSFVLVMLPNFVPSADVAECWVFAKATEGYRE